MPNPDPNLFIVEVDSFEGEHASIAVTDARGAPLRAVYCIARRVFGYGNLSAPIGFVGLKEGGGREKPRRN